MPIAPELKIRINAEMKQADLAGNRLRGVAAVMGNLDYGQDVIFPGAFKKAIPDFLKKGFVAEGHDWYELPIAMPISAAEDGNALVTEAEFHTTQDAQDARTVVRERLDRGLQVGLSVGFQSDPMGTHYFENGENLLSFAADNKYDLSMFDAVAIKAYDGWCRAITKIAELFEYSIVTVPMNPLAVATEAKSASGNTALPIADRERAWDASAAEGRVREWAGATDAPNTKYRQAFFWYDAENADKFGSYHLGFADVIDGGLTAIPRGVFAAAGALQGARGADGEKYADAKPKVEKYYSRFRKKFNDDGIVVPWADQGKIAVFDLDDIDSIRDVERTLRDAGFSKSQALQMLSITKGILLRRDAGSDDGALTTPTADELAVIAAGATPVEIPKMIPPADEPKHIVFSSQGRLIQCPF